MKVYRRLFQYFKTLKGKLFLGLFCLLVMTLANLMVPLILQEFISILERLSIGRLNFLVFGFFLLFFIKGIFYYSQAYLLALVGQKVALKLREELYHHLQYMSLAFHQRMQVGELISRITNDTQVVENSLVLALPGLIAQPLTVVGSVAFLFMIHWKLALFTLAVFPFIAMVINNFGSRMRQVSNKIQAAISDITTIVQENFSAIRIIKAFSKESDESKKYDKALVKNFNSSMKSVQIMATMNPIIELLASIGGIAFFWYGGMEVIRGNLTTAELVGFIAYLGIIIKPLSLISRDLNLMQRAAGALERIFEILDVEEYIIEKDNPIQLPPIKGNVEFDHVTMGYNDREVEVLKDISLKVKPGQVVAFVGESGAGKTTLVNLIPRFYDPIAGKITIDGFDLRDVTIKSLRKQIAIVPQETILFKGTIAYNIAYGKKGATMEEIEMAARRANAHQFITDFSEGYQTMVGERGQSLSGGQRQRISIARAILADPKILILDEATSALDTASELLVKEALNEVMLNRTTFLIAHRLSTVVNADLIVVLDKGKIVEMGTHDELLDKEEYYYRLYQAQ
ncbi:MAG: ABC transporter ATP-binding protein [Halanaerobiales bacterium]|nr:ABC transporter ATP-binding protein [Halanaerobiales bacterium]